MILISHIKKISEKFGRMGLVLLLLYPVLVIPMTAYALVGSLVHTIHALRLKPWKNLTGNTMRVALNNYFYCVQDLNLSRFGRYGTSTLVAGGNEFSLKNWFHTTPISLRLQSSLGVIAMLLISMLVWTSSWLFITDPTWHNIVIILLAIFSTYFFANFIDGQNYNIWAWMLLPLTLWALFAQNYILYSILLFCLSFLSFTSIFILSIISTIFALYWLDPYPVMAVIPAGTKIFIPILASIMEGSIKKMGGAVGIHDKVKYRRDDKKITAWLLYLSTISILFIVIYFIEYGADNYFVLQIAVFALFLINGAWHRFADYQTFYIIFLSTFCFSLIDKNPSAHMLIAYALSVNPFYAALYYPPLSNPVSPSIRKPIDTTELLQNIDNFIQKLQPKSRTLFLFKNPQNQYNKAFDGYRVIIEPLLYKFQKKDMVLFPDWFYLFEYNRITDTDLLWWNECPKQLKEGIIFFNLDYILTYDGIFQGDAPNFLKVANTIYIDYIEKNLILYEISPAVRATKRV